MASNNYIFFNENRTIVNYSSNQALTASQIFSGFNLYRFTASATVTLPAASDLIATGNQTFSGALNINDTFKFNIFNATGGAGTLTIAAGSGGTLLGVGTLAAGQSCTIMIVMTNVTTGTAAYSYFVSPCSSSNP